MIWMQIAPSQCFRNCLIPVEKGPQIFLSDSHQQEECIKTSTKTPLQSVIHTVRC